MQEKCYRVAKEHQRKTGVEKGMLLEVTMEKGGIMMKPLDLWGRVWGCSKGKGSVEKAELELDREEERFWSRRKRLAAWKAL